MLGAISVQLNVHGSAFEPRTAIDLFDGPFVLGAQLQILMGNGREAFGRVAAVESENQVVIEVGGGRWRLARAPDRSLRISSESNVYPEMWEIGGAL
jgi:hypothetical protein